MQDLYGDLRKVSRKSQNVSAASQAPAPKPGIAPTEATVSHETNHGSLNDLIQQRRIRDEKKRSREIVSSQEEALLKREEELDRRELSILQAELNLVRRIENERRLKEDSIRKEEDERRRQEDARRAKEEERRRAEDSRRAKEDADVEALNNKIRAHENRKIQRQEMIKQEAALKVLQDRSRQLEEMLVHYQATDPTVVDFAPLLLDRIDMVVVQNSEITDLDVLFTLVISDGSTKYSGQPKPKIAAPQSPSAPKPTASASPAVSSPVASSNTTSSKKTVVVMSDDDDEFFMLDESPQTPKKSVSQQSPRPRTLEKSPSNPLSPSQSSTLSSSSSSSSSANQTSQIRRSAPANPLHKEMVPDSSDSEDQDDPEFWVMLDATDDPTVAVSQKSRLSIIRRIQRHLLGDPHSASGSSAVRRTQEFPTTLTRTEDFLAKRHELREKRSEDMKNQITKLLPAVERLSDSDTQFDPIANFGSWNPLKKLVISNKETWNACGECGEYFDMLSIKHNCRLCLKAVCSKCGVDTKAFSPTLVGISGQRNSTVEVKCCKSCREALAALERQQMLQKWRVNPRFRAFSEKYDQAKASKAKILSCVAALDKLVGSLGPQTNASSVPVEKLQEISKAEQALVAALQEYQELVGVIGRFMEAVLKQQNSQAATEGAAATAESAEHRFLSYMRQSMLNFLTENRKLITHYRVLHQGILSAPDAPKPAQQPAVSSVPPQPQSPQQQQPQSPIPRPVVEQPLPAQLRPTPQGLASPVPVPMAAVPKAVSPVPGRPKSPPPPYRPSPPADK